MIALDWGFVTRVELGSALAMPRDPVGVPVPDIAPVSLNLYPLISADRSTGLVSSRNKAGVCPSRSWRAIG